MREDREHSGEPNGYQRLATAPRSSSLSAGQHLTDADIAEIGVRLDALRHTILSSRGASDARYIRRVIGCQRRLELSSRALLCLSAFRPAWAVGTAGLAVAKILDNMEIGHNVLHGQWDWMRDPKIHSSTWEWDFAAPASLWKQAHNVTHHTFTNILGRDNDLGYGILRVDRDQMWRPRHLAQPLLNLLNACLFEYGIAAYDLELGETLRQRRGISPRLKADARTTWRKVRRQVTKDFVLFPLLAGPWWRRALAANAVACLVRNVWSHSVIMCGHFPEGVETFEQEAVPDPESRGQWYVRQMLGSADISGSRLLHLMTGNLSHQIEHHLFPDLPSNRYAEIAVEVRALFDTYGLSYQTGSLPRQVGSAWRKVIRLSLPNDWLALAPLRTVSAGPVSDHRGGRRAQSRRGRVFRRVQPAAGVSLGRGRRL